MVRVKNKENIKKRYAGVHLLAEFWSGKIIDNAEEIKEVLLGAAKAANNTPLEVIVHKFLPQGATGVVLLAESHIAIHTWPEINYIAIDIFTCGDEACPEKALNYFKRQLRPRKIQVKKLKRGKL